MGRSRGTTPRCREDRDTPEAHATNRVARRKYTWMTEINRSDAAHVLGAHLSADGCHFGLWAPRAERVELALVDGDGSTQRNVDMTPDGGAWSVFVPDVVAGQRYGFRVHAQWDPDQGLRANPAKLLVDPYARAITAGVDYSGPIFDHVPGSYFEPDTRDSAGSVPLSVVVADSPAPEPIAERRPLEECVIYETHVKGLTQLHPTVPEHLRGRFAGVAYPAVTEHLKSLGVNAVEFLPVHHFISEPFVMGRGLSNYWGYNSLGFFAPHAAYCSVGTEGDQVAEFKEMVTALHRAGIEVILDVVYNHTCEGNHEGPTLSFRGIDHRGYYRLTDDLRNDYDITGTGNSVNTAHADVLAMVVDSMRYWVQEMGVDGFRFDLATELIRDGEHHVDQNHDFKKLIAQDPAFKGVKMIAEPWDLGPYGYQVGNWGPGWSEWNDRFRGYMRDYWRGQVDGVDELATRLSGSADLFDHDDRPPSSSINFFDAHDGFPLRDLVTYNEKHNEANGEDNRDGSDDNRSWNCGVEGETADEVINALRHRQIRNMVATLMLSDGVPMYCAGDEMGRTQQGNNNAYCQDGPINWLRWDQMEEWGDVLDTVRTFTDLRMSTPLLHANDYRYRTEITDPAGAGLGRYELAWMNGSSGEMGEADWHDGSRRLLGMYVSDASSVAYLSWFYSGDQPIQVQMPPAPWGESFHIVASTCEDGEVPDADLAPGDSFTMPPRTVVTMRVAVMTTAPVPDDQPVTDQEIATGDPHIPDTPEAAAHTS
ncbi:glycogen debranching protein GlgX [Propionibacterium freudenreichii]|nr:glycogen debranching enzyme GlgX [Propionibacterium freudenreichii]MCT2993873.1 glycogen debranching enzyme GlgX [Propionibacterium freudenreichii]MDK9649787.1 glycogen debranching protein GlgX [Propionibacterium freudenreichii]MDK9663885.1 glycogen debranching protein GlgX [Propionibacterium freudenreichii]